MSAVRSETRQPQPTTSPDRRKWIALAVISLAQLMIALDATIVSIALPSAQAALGASDVDRQWVVTAYTLAFGGLLLLGGRIADSLGRKRAFMVGLAGFAAASVLGGAAPSFGVLVAARALQGAFAALLAPTALSLLAVSFTQSKERATAFAVYGSIAGSGAAIGMLLGGALTQYFAWRWCLYVNLPIAGIAAVGGWGVLPASSRRASRDFDIPGVLLVTAGLVSLVYACSAAVMAGWFSGGVIGLLVASVVLLALFALRESRTANPLLPLRLLADRNRAGAYITVGLGVAGMFGAFLFLTYYMQAVLHYTPLQAGLGFLPITIASQAGSWLIARRLMPRLSPLQVNSDYVTLVLPAEILLGLGISSMMVPAFSLATRVADARESGVASATVNAAQQIGASLGIAVLNTVAAGTTAAFVGPRADALVHGFSVATACGASILVLAAAVAAVLINAPRPQR
jgi:EmrB/QacA subfamily drug resistance transporter